jgi:hypothetical protein
LSFAKTCSELPVADAPAQEAVYIPPRYPTALIFVDESAVKVSAGRFFVIGAIKARKSGQLLRAVQDVRDRYGYYDEFSVQLADLVAGAVANQCGQAAGTAGSSSPKSKIAARLAAAFGVAHLRDVRADRVNIATLGLSHTRRLRGVSRTSPKAS